MLYYAGLFLLLSREFPQAQKYIEMLMKNYPTYRDVRAASAGADTPTH